MMKKWQAPEEDELAGGKRFLIVRRIQMVSTVCEETKGQKWQG